MTPRKVAILQSNYIPWKGYFDLINLVDEFILYDDVQYTVNDWRNRNRIKTPEGAQWLTIPIQNQFGQKIHQARVSRSDWAVKHWKSIRQNYSKSKHFKLHKDRFESLYLDCKEDSLSRINRQFVEAICQALGIKTRITWSMDYALPDGKTERLVHLCKDVKATEYLSGPSAKAYLDEALFEKENISVSYMDYSGYPEYPQLFPPFEHSVSVLDLIFNTGEDAPRFMKSFKEPIRNI